MFVELDCSQGLQSGGKSRKHNRILNEAPEIENTTIGADTIVP